MPTSANLRIIVGVSSIWTKWYWISWRVVIWTTASAYSSDKSANTRIWLGVTAPNGIFMRNIPGASQTVSGPFNRSPLGYFNSRICSPSLRWALSYLWPYTPFLSRVSANILSSIFPNFFSSIWVSKILICSVNSADISSFNISFHSFILYPLKKTPFCTGKRGL